MPLATYAAGVVQRLGAADGGRRQRPLLGRLGPVVGSAGGTSRRAAPVARRARRRSARSGSGGCAACADRWPASVMTPSSGSRWARRAPRPPGCRGPGAPAGRSAATSRGRRRRPGSARGRPPRRAWPVLGAGLAEPVRRVDHRRDVAVGRRRAARRTRSPRPPVPPTASGSGPDTSADTAASRDWSTAESRGHLVLADGDAVVTQHRVGESGLDVAADHEDAVLGPELRALDHVRRDAVVGVVLQLAVPAAHEPDQCRRPARPAPPPRPRARPARRQVLREAVADESVCPEHGGDQERRLQGDHEEPEAGGGVHGGQLELQQREPRSEQGGDERDDPADQDRDPGRAPAPAPRAASTTSRMPSHHGAPGSPIRPVTSSRKPTSVIGSFPASSSSRARLRGAAPAATRARAGRAPSRAPRRAAPDRAVAHQAGADREPGTDHDQREDDAEPEQQRRERRPEREQQRAPPRRPPAAVGLRVGEPERGVGQPRQQARPRRPRRTDPRPRRR